MAFTLQESGTREGIAKHLADLPEEKFKGTDAGQVKAIRDLVSHEIAAIDEKHTGVRVDIHASATPTLRSIHVNVIPLNVRI